LKSDAAMADIGNASAKAPAASDFLIDICSSPLEKMNKKLRQDTNTLTTNVTCW
jgi:hypothetical protein